MATKKDPAQPPDEWTQRLQSTLRRRRPRFWRSTAFICLPLALVGSFLLWLAYPRPEPPRLLVVGLDTLLTTEESPTVRARLEPQDNAVTEPRTEGIELLFFDAGPAKGQRRDIKSPANAQGEATPAWPLPEGETTAYFLVRHIGEKYRPVPDDRGRLFRWPADSKLILVDVVETLLGGNSEALREGSTPDLKPAQAAAKVLNDARAKDHRIVYLADQPARALDYRPSRSWVEQLYANGTFPDGPILGRRSYAENVTAAEARLDLAKDLRQRFTGPLLAVVGKVDTAQLLRQQGLTPLLLGDAPASPEIARLKSWEDLPAWIGK